MENQIVKLTGKNSGPTLAIFGGVHGNEKAGVLALQWAKDNLQINSGTVYLVVANAEAVASSVRQINKNMNRCFLFGNNGDAYEDGRARELMQLLDGCDALLDLHASSSDKSTPFVICEQPSFAIAKLLGVPLVSTGWDAIEPGATDGYMFRQNKVGICVECYGKAELEAGVSLARECILRFLACFDVIDYGYQPPVPEPKLFCAKAAIKKQTDDFSFAREFVDFETLAPGELIATDGGQKYFAQPGDVLLFPDAKCKIGDEVFVLGKYQDFDLIK